MIVAGESSGELYGSLLARKIRSLWPEVRLLGVGGKKMRDSGVEIVSGISSSFGLTEAVSSMRKIRESFGKVSRALGEVSPEVVVLIDYPDFNFRVAKIAKRHALKVLYYVSPQVWAWRKGRVKTMREIADRVAVILPFEEEIYKNAGIPCEFVGHPVIEEIEEYKKNAECGVRNKNKSEIKSPVISLLPGSRSHELRTLLPVFIDLERLLREEFAGCNLVMPLAPNIETEKVKKYIDVLERRGVKCVKGEAIRALASSDMAVVASGTATLQAALLGIPMVVVYKLSPFTYFVGKNVLDIKHISLVNIIAGREVVPELIQHMANAENIMSHLRKISYDDAYRTGMISSFDEIGKIFSGRRPSSRVAEMAGEMAGWI